ncbi:MAG TPA: MarR family transcriptional regulator [Nitrospirota bacterium]|nr:MarR family transcriptional regulator [Nitrospirota bacterium]
MSTRLDTVAEIIDNLRRVFQVVNAQSKKAEHETGLTGPQLWAIKTIAQEAPIMVSEIARRMYLHPATVVGILDRLEKQGLVKRIRSTEDRRVVRVELSERGQALVKKSPEVAQGLLVAGLERLSTNKLNSIARALDQMAEILGAQNIPPQLILSPEVNKPYRTVAGAVRAKSAGRRRPTKTKP